MDEKISNREALNIALKEEMERDTRVFVLGEEVGRRGGPYKVTKGLIDIFGERRVMDTPISEMGFTGMAVGAAFMGLRPVVDFMTWNFALQSIDQIINSAAKTLYMSGGLIKTPIVFRGPNGVSPGVGAQHTQDFCAYYGAVPGLKVVAPFSARDHRGLLKSAIRDPNPVVFLENEILYDFTFNRCSTFNDTNYCQDLNKAIIEQEGSEITLIGISITVDTCLKAAKLLEKKDISCEVINLISISPIDWETIKRSVIKTRRCAIVDNGWKNFSVASEISAGINEMCFGILKCKILRLNGAFCPTPYAKNLEDMSFPTPEIVESAILELCK
ncbi:Pyruvate dehydrogenase E1 component subunit beta, mitochondrial [Astathelohania contejeani]|uniref:Pyruvate dehydrogenase E1 component subunit beta n=1 Tax=Astathelohania contejeani TaxID=164912 RepID=A0ABQ7HYZ6_9MICR|nr:Pyruvate dehydrogenase E1 component subunit beta, mitochondrial [Thelohania contejeani]